MDLLPNEPTLYKLIPPGQKGVAEVKHCVVSPSESEFTKLRAMMHPGEFVKPGTYVQLYVNHRLMMSDTSEEKRSNYSFVRNAKGDVLIGGLGIGMVLDAILKKDEVKRVVVVEKYQDVIDLVTPYFKDKRLQIICDDIFDFKTAYKYDTIYFDIWPDITTDNLEGMATLHRKFAKRKNPGAWMDSWQKDLLKSRLRQEKQQIWWR